MTYGIKFINQEEAEKILYGTQGKIFSVFFTKKDGSERKLVGRIGVKKGVTGVGLKYDPKERGLLTVFDLQKDEFRTVNLNSLKAIASDGIRYEIADEPIVSAEGSV